MAKKSLSAADPRAKQPVKATAKARAPTKTATVGKAPASKITAGTKKRAATASAKAPAKAAAPITVTLRHLSAALAEQHALPKKQADTIVTDVFSSVIEHLKAGERVKIGGLGIIEVKNRPARPGRNPATGESIQIKASKKIAFRAAKELKDAI